jgi:undecaprenyl-diphosphatase
MRDPSTASSRSGIRGVLTDFLYTTLRFIARHVKGFFGALAAFLTVGFLLSFAAAAMFAALATAVAGGLTQSLDETVLSWLSQHRSAVFTDIMQHFSILGSGMVLIMIVLVSSAFLWQTQHRWSVYVLLFGTIGGTFLNTILKMFFDRERPSVVEWEDMVRTSSFPSGHAMTSLVTYGSIAYLVARLDPNPWLKRIIWVLATLIIAGIGLSRMYLGVHYPSDVLAGFVAGLAWLALVASTVAAIRFFAARRPETRVEEEDLQNK